MGKIITLILVALTAASIWMFVGQRTLWFPRDVSEHGKNIDSQFMLTLVVVGIAFTGAQLALGYAVWRYGRKGNDRAVYTHGSNKLEATWTIITAGIFIAVAILGQRVWANLHLNAAPADALKVNVIAQQFQFNFHYAGVDGVFGKTSPEFYDDGSQNYVGLDPNDEAGKDDLQLTTLVISEGRPVELSLRSKDVIHSFFVPACRVKQDMVPGMAIKIHFTPTEPGKYEIPCAELCGNGHYKMKSFLLVVAKDDYEQMEKMPRQQFRARMDELLKQYP
jgi:cytochrome c oxidase subunit II